MRAGRTSSWPPRSGCPSAIRHSGGVPLVTGSWRRSKAACVVDAAWTADKLDLAHPISAQHSYSLLTREIEIDVLEVTRRFGLGLIPYYPLESGFLTGKYRPGATPSGTRLSSGPRADRVLSSENFERLEKLERFATGRGRSLLQLALGWLLSRPEVATVIAGASSGDQVRLNIEASGWRLDVAEMAEVAAI